MENWLDAFYFYQDLFTFIIDQLISLQVNLIYNGVKFYITNVYKSKT